MLSEPTSGVVVCLEPLAADDDGIVVIRAEEAEDLLKACQERFGQTLPIREWIAAGKPVEDYPGVRK